jgi:hypothetical protein
MLTFGAGDRLDAGTHGARSLTGSPNCMAPTSWCRRCIIGGVPDLAALIIEARRASDIAIPLHRAVDDVCARWGPRSRTSAATREPMAAAGHASKLRGVGAPGRAPR